MKPLLLGLFLLAAAIPVSASGDGILLATGGGPGSPQFFVHLDPAGLLAVERREMLKESKTFEVQLANEQATALVALAAASDDFHAGCNTVADGTNAEMKVVKGDMTLRFHCFGARTWPTGAHTEAFINRLNSLLPAEFDVF